MFRGFDRLPTAVVRSLRGFPHFLVARRGELTLREREIVARAITGEPSGAFGSDPQSLHDEAQRASASLEAAPEMSTQELELAAFAEKVAQPRFAITDEDVGRLLWVGYEPDAVREAIDVALAFRVVHRITDAVNAQLAQAGPDLRFAAFSRPWTPPAH